MLKPTEKTMRATRRTAAEHVTVAQEGPAGAAGLAVGASVAAGGGAVQTVAYAADGVGMGVGEGDAGSDVAAGVGDGVGDGVGEGVDAIEDTVPFQFIFTPYDPFRFRFCGVVAVVMF